MEAQELAQRVFDLAQETLSQEKRHLDPGPIIMMMEKCLLDIAYICKEEVARPWPAAPDNSFMIRVPVAVMRGNVSVKQFYDYVGSLGDDIQHLHATDYITIMTRLSELASVTMGLSDLGIWKHTEEKKEEEPSNDLQ